MTRHAKGGQWDAALFARLFAEYRRARAGTPRRRRLLENLIEQNEPLVIDLIAQLRGEERASGKAKPVRFRGGSFGRVLEAEKLDWDDALNAGRVALMKAMDRFDPSKGGLPGYLKRKCFYELQARVGKSGIVTVDRGERAAAFDSFEDGDHMDRVLADVAELEGEDGFEDAPEVLELEEPELEEELPDTRSAVEVLFEDHCRFARHARCAREPLFGRFTQLARTRGELAPRATLLRALDARNVRPTWVRVPWNPTPVRGFAGICVQPSASPPRVQTERVGASGRPSGPRRIWGPAYLPVGGYNGPGTHGDAQRGAPGVPSRDR